MNGVEVGRRGGGVVRGRESIVVIRAGCAIRDTETARL